MRIVASDGVTPAPLFLHKRSPSGDIILTLRVDAPMWWTLQIAKVIHAPTNALAGKQFQDVASAWAELRRASASAAAGTAIWKSLLPSVV